MGDGFRLRIADCGFLASDSGIQRLSPMATEGRPSRAKNWCCILARKSGWMCAGKMILLHLLAIGRAKKQNSVEKFNLASTKFFRSYRECELKPINCDSG